MSRHIVVRTAIARRVGWQGQIGGQCVPLGDERAWSHKFRGVDHVVVEKTIDLA